MFAVPIHSVNEDGTYMEEEEEIPFDTYSWNEISPNFDSSWEYDLKNFPHVFRSL